MTATQRDALYARTLREAAARGVVAVHEHSAPGIDTRAGLAALLAMSEDPRSGRWAGTGKTECGIHA